MIEGDLTIPESQSFGYIQFIEGKIKDIFAAQVDHKKLLNDIKDLICENAKAEDLVEIYSSVMKTVVEKLKEDGPG